MVFCPAGTCRGVYPPKSQISTLLSYPAAFSSLPLPCFLSPVFVPSSVYPPQYGPKNLARDPGHTYGLGMALAQRRNLVQTFNSRPDLENYDL